jgi:alanyl-tRNA synthetase
VIQFGNSIELCGGTHVDVTSQIGVFKIVSEGSIASGIRRIEAITGERALAWYQDKEKTLRQIEEMLNNPQDVVKAVTSVLDDKNNLLKQVELYEKEHVASFKTELLKSTKQVADIRLISLKADSRIDHAGIIREAAFQLRGEMDDLVLIVGAVFGGKPHLAVMVSDKLIQSKKLNAGEIVKTAAREFNGGGGGQPFFATAGGKDADKLEIAMNKASELILQAI